MKASGLLEKRKDYELLKKDCSMELNKKERELS
jgi:hypothetical protein